MRHRSLLRLVAGSSSEEETRASRMAPLIGVTSTRQWSLPHDAVERAFPGILGCRPETRERCKGPRVSGTAAVGGLRGSRQAGEDLATVHSLNEPMTPEALVEEFTASLPYQLDDFQLEAIRALANRHSVLVAAPTGTGKTIIGQFGTFIARKHGARAIYTTPIKALSNQKFRDFRRIWGDDEVGLLNGDVVVNRDAPILVMTTDGCRRYSSSRAAATRVRGTDEPYHAGHWWDFHIG